MNIFEHLQQVKIFDCHLFGWDLAITNGVLTSFLAVTLVLCFFYAVSRQAQLKPSLPQTIAESVIQFIKEEMLAPLGNEADKWLPLLVSLFCFILISNLLGIIPGLLPPTANINVTATLAVIIFIITQAAGIIAHGLGGYLQSIVPPGLPLIVAILLFPIELIGQLVRPFSLAIRLFANVFAGHTIILVLLSLILVFKSYLVAPFPVVGSVAIMAFEIFVSFIQAFIFTFLSSSYIIGAVQTQH